MNSDVELSQLFPLKSQHFSQYSKADYHIMKVISGNQRLNYWRVQILPYQSIEMKLTELTWLSSNPQL